MNQKVIAFNKSLKKSSVNIPDLKAGDIVRVHRKIKEGEKGKEKERIQVFKGLVIAIKGRQSSSPMVTVRRDSQGVGVEAVFPIYAPFIAKIELLRHSKVRRSKLYYMRGRTGKNAKMKVLDLSDEEKKKIKNELVVAA